MHVGDCLDQADGHACEGVLYLVEVGKATLNVGGTVSRAGPFMVEVCKKAN